MKTDRSVRNCGRQIKSLAYPKRDISVASRNIDFDSVRYFSNFHDPRSDRVRPERDGDRICFRE
jgi:hypothetical protein